jgi:hypothetical protein
MVPSRVLSKVVILKGLKVVTQVPMMRPRSRLRASSASFFS